MNTDEIQLVSLVCVTCGDRFWSEPWDAYVMCDMCENYEPLEFDDWE